MTNTLMRGSLVTFCAFLAFAVLCVEGVVTDELCGQVYDGLTEGRSDMDTLPSTSILGANWDGFDSSVLSYDWAIFSESVISQTTDFSRCWDQLLAVPDVQSWQSVGKQKHGVNGQLSLVAGVKYYSAVRATTTSGEYVYALSNGVRVVTSIPSKEIAQLLPVAQVPPLKDAAFDSLSYGPLFAPLAGFLQANVEGDDHDPEQYAWVIAPIVGGIMGILCCLAMIIFLCCLIAGGRGLNLSGGRSEPKEKKAKPAKPKSSGSKSGGLAFADTDMEQKGYGMREEVDTMDASSNTVVEFPDTQIRRLSISHKDEEATVAGGEPKRGRAPHPIMVSASSSFRDYRSGVSH